MPKKQETAEKPVKELPSGVTELPMTVGQLKDLGLFGGSDSFGAEEGS